jgi:dihydroflavonol-4-reductase
VDVRDVADGILRCAERGEKGECYFLTNLYVTVPQLFDTLTDLTGRKRIRTFLPLWFIRLTAPLAELYYRLLRQKPLFTRYSIHTLGSNAVFCHDKAAMVLGYHTRPFRETLADTLRWCGEAGLFKKA